MATPNSAAYGLTSSWEAYARGAAPAPLWWRLATAPLAAIYGILVRGRGSLYSRGFLPARRLPGTVISVGNLAAGGTGKSPVTAALAALLLEAGAKPAILTRGYGSTLAAGDSLALLGGKLLMAPAPGDCTWPDEARMQSEALPSVPVIAGRRRHAAASRFLREHGALAPTHWLLDDGFQHRRLARDLDIVLLDAAAPFGNGRLLPRGILREPPAALMRAGMIIFTRATAGSPSDVDKKRLAACTRAPVFLAPFGAPALAASVDGKAQFAPSAHAPVLLATAVAGPALVAAELERQRVAVAGHYCLPDHANFGRADLVARLGSAKAVITTAKDYWRDPQVFAGLPVPVFVLGLTVQWDVNAVRTSLKTWLNRPV